MTSQRGARIYVHPGWDFRLLDVAALAADHNLVLSNAGTIRGRTLIELHPYRTPEQTVNHTASRPLLYINGRARIRETGWEGTLVAGKLDIDGSERYEIQYTTLDGKPRRQWFDADQLQPLTTETPR